MDDMPSETPRDPKEREPWSPRKAALAYVVAAVVAIVAIGGMIAITNPSPAEERAQAAEQKQAAVEAEAQKAAAEAALAESEAEYEESVANAGTVTYTVTGGGTPMVTLVTADGIQQDEGPGEWKVTGMESDDFVSVSAQNSGDYGDVTCTITDGDGNVIAENTSSAAYGIASCDGSLGGGGY